MVVLFTTTDGILVISTANCEGAGGGGGVVGSIMGVGLGVGVGIGVGIFTGVGALIPVV